MTIGHSSSVSVRCNYSTNTQSIELTCDRGIITPPSIHCESGMRKSREELLNLSNGNKVTTTIKPALTSSVSSVYPTTSTTVSSIVAIARPHPIKVENLLVDTNDYVILNSVNTNDSSTMEEPKMCGSPTMMDNALVYK